MTLEELKNDCNVGNFGMIPQEVMDYVNKHAYSYTSFATWIYAYKWTERVVLRVFAFRKKTGKKLEITEVSRRSPGVVGEVYRNMWYTSMSGYHVCYKPEDHHSWYAYNYISKEDFNKWWADDKRAGIFAPLINPEQIFESPKYQYCGYSGKQSILDYLELYDKDPLVEYFGKAGLVATRTLVNLAKKDKQFAKFLRKNVEACNSFGPQASIYAYKHNMTVKDAYEFLCYKKTAEKFTRDCEGIQTTGVNRIKLYEYCHENGIGPRIYADYWKAIRYLGLDINDTKNVYPKDFWRMHDLRIDEYSSRTAAADLEAKANLSRAFIKIADKYRIYEIEGQKYAIVLPKNIGSLVKEGNELHHCVGKMGYDQKMAREETIIAFVRKKEEKDKPFVTIEYKPRCGILQCYGDHDSNPGKEVKKFADSWAKHVNKKLAAM